MVDLGSFIEGGVAVVGKAAGSAVAESLSSAMSDEARVQKAKRFIRKYRKDLMEGDPLKAALSDEAFIASLAESASMFRAQDELATMLRERTAQYAEDGCCVDLHGEGPADKCSDFALELDACVREVHGDGATIVQEIRDSGERTLEKLSSIAPIVPNRETLIEHLRARSAVTRQTSGSYHIAQVRTELFPDLSIGSLKTVVRNEGGASLPLLEFLDESAAESCHYEIVGPGGAGKTVAMQATEEALLSRGELAIYIALHDVAFPASGGEPIRQHVERNVLGTAPLLRAFEDARAAEGRVTVLLDGWNEVSGCGPHGQLLIDIVKHEIQEHWMTQPHVRVVISGRECIGKTAGWYRKLDRLDLEGLRDEQIAGYFSSNRLECPDLKGRLGETLRNPLMLMLYTCVELFYSDAGNDVHFGFITDKRSTEPAAIIFNFTQCQVAKFCRQRPQDSYEIALAMVYGASVIGYEMAGRGLFAIARSEAIESLERATGSYSGAWLGSRALRHICEAAGVEQGSWSPTEILESLCRSVFLVRVDDCRHGDPLAEPRYGFSHQLFRDFFAAMRMLVDLRPYGNRDCPEECALWRLGRVSVECLDMLCTLLEGKCDESDGRSGEHGDGDAGARIHGRKIDALWDSQRGVVQGNGSQSVALLLVIYQMMGVSIASLDFSGIDLRGVSLTDLDKDWGGVKFTGAFVSRSTFEATGHRSSIKSATWFPEGEMSYKDSSGNAAFAIGGEDITVRSTAPVGMMKSYDAGFGAGRLCVSDDGSTLVSCNYFNANVYSVSGGLVLDATIEAGDLAWIDCCASPEGDLIALFSRDLKICMFHHDGRWAGEPVTLLEPEWPGLVKGTVFDPSGESIAVVVEDGVVILALIERLPKESIGLKTVVLCNLQESVRAISSRARAECVRVLTATGELLTFSLADGAQVGDLFEDNGACPEGALGDRRYVCPKYEVSVQRCSDDDSVCIEACFSREGGHFALASVSELAVWRIGSPEPSRVIGAEELGDEWRMTEMSSVHESTPVPEVIALSEEGRYLLVGDSRSRIAVFDVRPVDEGGRYDPIATMGMWNAEIDDLQLLPNGIIVCRHGGNRIAVIDRALERCVDGIRLESPDVAAMVMSPNGKAFAVAYGNHDVHVMRKGVSGWQDALVAYVEYEVEELAFSQDCATLFIAHRGFGNFLSGVYAVPACDSALEGAAPIDIEALISEGASDGSCVFVLREACAPLLPLRDGSLATGWKGGGIAFWHYPLCGKSTPDTVEVDVSDGCMFAESPDGTVMAATNSGLFCMWGNARVGEWEFLPSASATCDAMAFTDSGSMLVKLGEETRKDTRACVMRSYRVDAVRHKITRIGKIEIQRRYKWAELDRERGVLLVATANDELAEIDITTDRTIWEWKMLFGASFMNADFTDAKMDEETRKMLYRSGAKA